MANFNMTIRHSQPAEEAVRRIKNVLAELKKQFADKISGLEENWNGNVCEINLSAMGFSGTATLTVRQTEIEIAGDIPFPASMFKGKIEAMLREKLGQILS